MGQIALVREEGQLTEKDRVNIFKQKNEKQKRCVDYLFHVIEEVIKEAEEASGLQISKHIEKNHVTYSCEKHKIVISQKVPYSKNYELEYNIKFTDLLMKPLPNQSILLPHSYKPIWKTGSLYIVDFKKGHAETFVERLLQSVTTR